MSTSVRVYKKQNIRFGLNGSNIHKMVVCKEYHCFLKQYAWFPGKSRGRSGLKPYNGVIPPPSFLTSCKSLWNLNISQMNKTRIDLADQAELPSLIIIVRGPKWYQEVQGVPRVM